MFSQAATDLIERKGAVPALAAALAQISGHTQPPKRRSLLMSALGQLLLNDDESLMMFSCPQTT